ncbi:class I SAM-dependent methyltransferase [Phycisphaerales bacterium AB-hyl4]|uniref:Demethylmenaquinone methyltransferase n=1 Tax=Natronomicrosphaera hydrolytica TaxID=3242702 RepID=A0ABV4U358_9BACT
MTEQQSLSAADATRTQPHGDLTAYYGEPENRKEYLRELFDDTAMDYDRILQYAFFGTGNFYRRRALRFAGLKPGMKLLDVACGTGVVTVQALHTLEPEDIVCVDPSPGMRKVASEKLGERTPVLEGSAEHLPVEDNQFDLLTMGYALRHVTSLEDAFTEYFRVLKPGGKVMLLEISRPKGRVSRFFTRLYMRDLVPLISRIVARRERGHTLMRYFWESIDQCVPPQTILDALESCGFKDVSRRAELGIFSAYIATKPEGND